MACGIDIRRADSTWTYIGHLLRSRSYVRDHGRMMKNALFGYGCALRDDVFYERTLPRVTYFWFVCQQFFVLKFDLEWGLCGFRAAQAK